MIILNERGISFIMKLRIKEVYPYHDTHCGRAPQASTVFIYNGNDRYSSFEKRDMQLIEEIEENEKSKKLVLTKKR